MKFRRKSAEAVEPAEPDTGATTEDATQGQAANGPFDHAEVAADGIPRIDLGSLLLVPGVGRDVRVQVEESTQTVQSVLVAGPDGAMELRAFAAPRNGDLWGDVRPQISADMTQRGGTVSEREGRFGTELQCQMPVKRPDGSSVDQPSRVIGINGQRWMLRATLLGRPAVDPGSAGEWEDTLARVVVRRGDGAMPVGDPLPITLPPQARKVQ